MGNLIGFQRGFPMSAETWLMVVRVRVGDGAKPCFGGLSCSPCPTCGCSQMIGVFFHNSPDDRWFNVCPVCGAAHPEHPVYARKDGTA